MATKAKTIIRYSKPLVHLLLAAPVVWLIWQLNLAYAGRPHGLGFNPLEYANRFTGIWALRILFISLAISPLARISHIHALVMYRRLAGLWAFTYALTHVTSYAWLDHELNWSDIWSDVTDRTYIAFGFTALILLIPMAATSTKWAMKTMGKQWKRLHQMVYGIGILVMIHFFMMVKGNQLEPYIYAAILSVLLGYRFMHYVKARLRRRRRKRSAVLPPKPKAAVVEPSTTGETAQWARHQQAL